MISRGNTRAKHFIVDQEWWQSVFLEQNPGGSRWAELSESITWFTSWTQQDLTRAGRTREIACLRAYPNPKNIICAHGHQCYR